MARVLEFFSLSEIKLLDILSSLMMDDTYKGRGKYHSKVRPSRWITEAFKSLFTLYSVIPLSPSISPHPQSVLSVLSVSDYCFLFCSLFSPWRVLKVIGYYFSMIKHRCVFSGHQLSIIVWWLVCMSWWRRLGSLHRLVCPWRCAA